MSESKIEAKIERKVQGEQSSDKTVHKGAKKSWAQRLKGILRPAFNVDRLRNVGFIGLVCVITIILFLTLKGGKKNAKNNDGG